jgi:NADH-quinone oxidoreductase subunit L
MEHPGLLYVAATLLPLASFLVLLLAGGLRAGLRMSREGTAGAALFQALGGDNPRWPAYVATGAIGAAFLCSLVGFVLFLQAHAGHGAHAAGPAHAAKEEAGEAGHEAAAGEEHSPAGWEDRWEWATLSLEAPDGSPRPATRLEVGYRIDHLAAIMFLMVTFIATLIHVFSIGYMGEELFPVVEDHQVHAPEGHLHRRGRFGRFFMFLSLFCFSMLNLVLADNLFQVFVSWELVGICSYLLIGFYFERQTASDAANKAFITNRVGDAGFILGMLILWTYVGTFNFEDLFAQVRHPLRDTRGPSGVLAAQVVRADPIEADETSERVQVADEPGEGSLVLLFPPKLPGKYHALSRGDTVRVNALPEFYAKNPEVTPFRTMPYWLLVVAGMGIFLGCVGKSAQFPLHVWLPDAMEGPTPVSALIHAATMVAAGVYLVGRVFPLFTPESRLVIAYTGAITLFVAATIAIVMTDIKKVLAYSTVSQLGYMMLALGIGGWAAGLFHLITHAFFKALLFLGSGSVIYGCHHEQDMLKMGGLYPKMKITALTMLVGVLAIAGTPLFSGWYSKDAIIAQAFGFTVVHKEHLLLFLLPLLTAGLTTFYMYRMWLLTFLGRPRDEHVYEHAHESPWVMTVPLMVLAFFSVVVAWGPNPFRAEDSLLEAHIHHSQHPAVIAEFGQIPGEEEWAGGTLPRPSDQTERYYMHRFHLIAGTMAMGLMVLALIFALLVYHYHVLDPAEAKEQFAGVYRFLANKWYFDELYSAVLVRPALTVAGWFRAFDLRVIDGLINGLGWATVRVSKGEGRFDNGVIDGLVNVTGDAIYAAGARLRRVQTGYLRSYILFLVLAVVGLFIVLSYFAAVAAAR